MREYTIGIDPGIDDLGVSLFRHGLMIATFLVKNDYKPAKNVHDKYLKPIRMGELLIETLKDFDIPPKDLTIVFEVSLATVMRTHISSLIRMGMVSGMMIGAMGSEVEWVPVAPQTWKRAKSKTEAHDRLLTKGHMRVLMSVLKRATKSGRLDILDAACIGVWYINQQKET